MVTVSAHSTVHLGTVSDLTEHTTATLDRILRNVADCPYWDISIPVEDRL